MKVTVKLFARARDLAGTGQLDLDVPAGATVATVRSELGRSLPALVELLARCAVGMDAEFARDDDLVREGAEIALLPPVSGG